LQILRVDQLPTGKIVKTAPPTVWNGGSTDQASGDKAWWFDFSEIEVPGRYAVADLEKGIRSADFSIGEHVYKGVMKRALRVFFTSAWGSIHNFQLIRVAMHVLGCLHTAAIAAASPAPTEFHAAAGAAPGQVVSSVQ
jgi:hypothetical protein